MTSIKSIQDNQTRRIQRLQFDNQHGILLRQRRIVVVEQLSRISKKHSHEAKKGVILAVDVV